MVAIVLHTLLSGMGGGKVSYDFATQTSFLPKKT